MVDKIYRELNFFSSWRMSYGLTEILAYGYLYTWTQNRELDQQIYEKLDWVYSDEAWRLSYPDATVWNYPIFLSDHDPILLDMLPTVNKAWGTYRYDSWCWSFEEVRSMVSEECNKIYNGSTMFQLKRKLQNIWRRMRDWCTKYKRKAFRLAGDITKPGKSSKQHTNHGTSW